MIKLFYTGSTVFNQPNTLASKSLGGFISSTAVPNGTLNSIFSPLSLMDFYGNKKIIEYIGLGLYLFFFEGEVSYDNIDLIFKLNYEEDDDEKINEQINYFKDLFTYKIGIAPISGDNTNGFYLEKITSKSKPYYLLKDFQELKYNEDIIFENIDLFNNGIGIWINRVLNPKNFKDIFGFEKDYWIKNDKLPNFDFPLKLNIDFRGNDNDGSIDLTNFVKNIIGTEGWDGCFGYYPISSINYCERYYENYPFVGEEICRNIISNIPNGKYKLIMEVAISITSQRDTWLIDENTTSNALKISANGKVSSKDIHSEIRTNLNEDEIQEIEIDNIKVLNHSLLIALFAGEANTGNWYVLRCKSLICTTIQY